MRLVVRCALGVLLGGLPAARAQCWLASVHGSGTDLTLGWSIDVPGDIDGDGLPDVAASVGNSATGQWMIRLLSGRDLSLIRNISSPTADPSFAWDIAGLSDIDGDGTPDVAGSSPAYPPGPGQPGRIEVFSGATGAVLHSMDGTATNSNLGEHLDAGPDVDGDGLPDLLAGTNSPTGLMVHVYSTSTWALLMSLPGYGKACVPGDVDLDGVPDIAVGFPNELNVFSTATGRVLLFKSVSPAWAYDLAPIGDLDADGAADLLVTNPGDATFEVNGGAAFAISGAGGATLQAVYNKQASANFGYGVSSAGDVDGDGKADLAVGAPHMYPPGVTSGWGAVQIRSSATGALLTLFRGETSKAFIGSHLVGPVDFNGDGFADVLESAPEDSTFVSWGGGLGILSARFGLQQLVPADVIAAAPGTVALHGYGFESGLPIAISVAGVPATAVTWVSPQLVTFVPPSGIEDSFADVSYEQGGVQAVAKQALHYVGPQILDIQPFAASKLGGETVHILGKHFATDGSTIVRIYAGTATIQSISEGEIVITTPPFTPGSPFNVEVIGSTGSDTSMAFKEDVEYGTPDRGNILGTTACVLNGLQVNHTTGTPKVFMEVGGPEAQVLAVTKTTMTIQVPALPEPDGATYHAYVSDPVKGNELISNVFFYTPYVTATFAAEALGGGHATLLLRPDPSASGPQFATAWIGLPWGSPISQHLPGFGGTLHELPWIFTHVHVPLPQPLPALDLTIPPYDPLGTGLVLRMQVLVTGEGLPKGTFTNAVSFVLP